MLTHNSEEYFIVVGDAEWIYHFSHLNCTVQQINQSQYCVTTVIIHFPKWNYTLNSNFRSLLLQPLVSTVLPSVSVDLATLASSYRETHNVFPFVSGLLPFVSEIHFVWRVNNMPLCTYTSTVVWPFVYSTNLYAEILAPNMVMLGGRDFGR